jgi:hypothetical protein
MTKIEFLTSIIDEYLPNLDDSMCEFTKDTSSLIGNAKICRRAVDVIHSKARTEGQHFAIKVPKSTKTMKYKGQHRCRYPGCDRRIQTFCLACDIPLCLEYKSGTSHFIDFHLKSESTLTKQNERKKAKR